MIKREDAIKAVAEYFSDDDDSHWNAIATYIIKDIPSAENKGEWIPCSERLPSKGVPVLVNGIMEDAPPITISTDAPLYYENGWINAWMPLPKPWEGADDE